MPERTISVLAAAVVARSAIFVFWSHAHFDSDQAVTGLMAKHLAELRAFPVFWYGQTYMLGVESWLAAPLMMLRVFGPTVTALKLPLLAMNIAIAVLLVRIFTRDAGLSSGRAGFATLFFVCAAPITAAHLLTANGGNVEPLLYVLLLWTLRSRPAWMGLVLGIGFLNREFTIYGVVAMIAVDAIERRLLTRESARRYAVAFAVAALVWFAFLGLRQISSAAGPGTTVADLYDRLAANNLVQVAERLCLNPRAVASGAGQILTVHWPELFGLEPQPLTDFGIESTVRQGLSGSAWLLLLVAAIPVVRIMSASPQQRRCDACAYLVAVAGLSVLGYLIGRCGVVDFNTMRYELLSVLGAAGLAAWYLRVERSRVVLGVWTTACAAIFAISLTAHVRLASEYLTRPPVPLKQDLIRELDARHIRYGYADFWVAYYVTFLTRERIILTPEDIVRIRTYNRIVDAHKSEAVRISRRPCPAGEQLTPAFWSCPP